MNDPQVLDFRRSGWGHAIHMPRLKTRTVQPTWWRKLLGAKPQLFEYLVCLGHSTPKPMADDVLLVPMQSGKTARFRVVETAWIGDPEDMFDIRRADFEGYLEDNEDRAKRAALTRRAL